MSLNSPRKAGNATALVNFGTMLKLLFFKLTVSEFVFQFEFFLNSYAPYEPKAMAYKTLFHK